MNVYKRDAKIMREESKRIIISITKNAESLKIDNNIPITRYINSGIELERMALKYKQNGNLAASYYLFTKLLILYIEKVMKHKQYSSLTTEQTKSMKQIIKRAFPVAEEVKSLLIDELDKMEKYDDGKVDNLPTNKSLNDVQNATKTAEKEEKIRDEILPASKEPIIDFSQISTHSCENDSSLTYQNTEEPVGFDFLKNYHQTNIVLENKNDNLHMEEMVQIEKPRFDRALKPKSSTNCMNINSFSESQANSLLRDIVETMRTVVFGADLIPLFKSSSSANTLNNIETCGVLVGNMEDSSFVITHVIMPKQTGTSDSCSSLDDHQVFEYQLKNDLITLGWIHTHPSQTCFLSSIDLHTQYAYQCLLKESVAFVVSEKYNASAIFSLTPRGMEVLSTCRQQGFHKHEESHELFKIADHHFVKPSLKTTFVDFRK